MVRADTLILIGVSNDPRGVYDAPAETQRQVLCTVRSVGMRESYEAMAHGLHPEWVFQLTHAFEYQGEKACLFQGVRYTILRTYVTEADGIELTAERSATA